MGLLYYKFIRPNVQNECWSDNEKSFAMCEHLILLDHELKSRGIVETYRGMAWSDKCREWVYYDCVLNLDAVRQRLKIPDCVCEHINDDARSGKEAGLFCTLCKDGVMGLHPDDGLGKQLIE